MSKTSVVIPNWNGADRLPACLDSLKTQTQPHDIVVVDNGSADGSAQLVKSSYPQVNLIEHSRNLGFAGGVNAGIRRATENDYRYVALLNNDAVADKNWLKRLVDFLDKHPGAGIATGKILEDGSQHLDSTGDQYTIWGLPYPRGRGERDARQYDKDNWVFAASGGASLYRVKMLKEIGLFDEDFFAYYEDVDISFRAQLAGWKVGYEPKAVVNHQIGATSGAIKGFTTYQTLKNLPFLFMKNVPGRLFWTVEPRFELAYASIFMSAVRRGHGWWAFKGFSMAVIMTPKKLFQRYKIQQKRKVSLDYIDSMMTHDLPPDANKLRRLRGRWWKLRGKS